MTAQLIRLADHRKRREPDAMSILLGTFEFSVLCNIAVLYALIACARITHQHARKG
jgi:hypothetical protein